MQYTDITSARWSSKLELCIVKDDKLYFVKYFIELYNYNSNFRFSQWTMNELRYIEILFS